MKLQSDFREQGLELPDLTGNPSGVRFKPDKEGVIEVPESLAGYAKQAAKVAPFRIAGQSWGGFGDGKMPKPYRED